MKTPGQDDLELLCVEVCRDVQRVMRRRACGLDVGQESVQQMLRVLQKGHRRAALIAQRASRRPADECDFTRAELNAAEQASAEACSSRFVTEGLFDTANSTARLAMQTAFGRD